MLIRTPDSAQHPDASEVALLYLGHVRIIRACHDGYDLPIQFLTLLGTQQITGVHHLQPYVERTIMLQQACREIATTDIGPCLSHGCDQLFLAGDGGRKRGDLVPGHILLALIEQSLGIFKFEVDIQTMMQALHLFRAFLGRNLIQAVIAVFPQTHLGEIKRRCESCIRRGHPGQLAAGCLGCRKVTGLPVQMSLSEDGPGIHRIDRLCPLIQIESLIQLASGFSLLAHTQIDTGAQHFGRCRTGQQLVVAVQQFQRLFEVLPISGYLGQSDQSLRIVVIKRQYLAVYILSLARTALLQQHIGQR